MAPIMPENCPLCAIPTQEASPFCPRCGFDLLYGTPKKEMIGACAYCDFRGKLTAEHIFPSWIKNIYPRRSKNRKHTLSRPQSHVMFEKNNSQTRDFPEQGNLYDITVYNVCKKCNNGWMSQLQNDAKPIVLKLANGDLLDFDKTETEILSRWCMMVTVNLEKYGRIETITPHQRKVLKEGKMPPGCLVSIGQTVSVTCPGYSNHRTASMPFMLNDEEYIKIQSTIFVIERAVFHTISTLSDMILHYAKYADINVDEIPLRRIWPNQQTVSERIGLDLDKTSLEYIQTLFADT